MADLNAQTEDDFEDALWMRERGTASKPATSNQRSRAAETFTGRTFVKKNGMVWDLKDLSQYAKANEPSSAYFSCYSRAYYSAESRLFDHDTPSIAKVLQETSQLK
jgi:hypothetical protein